MKQTISETLNKNDFIDLTFNVTTCNKYVISPFRIEYDVYAKALYKDKTIGFGLKISATKKLFQSFKVGIGINSLGLESDSFLNALAGLYGLNYKNKLKMKNYVPCDFISFTKARFPKQYMFDREKVFLKLFFGNTDGNKYYSELYLNIDLPNKAIELNEKDEEYRKNIIKCFSEK